MNNKLFLQFHEAWRKLTDWLEEAEKRLDSELEISNEPDKIKVQLAKHKVLARQLSRTPFPLFYSSQSTKLFLPLLRLSRSSRKPWGPSSRFTTRR